MLISTKWLKKYIPELGTLELKLVAETLTRKLAEVEQIIPVRQELEQIYCALVKSVSPVTGSKKLSLCEVELTDKTIKKIICGAPNVKQGIKVALALVGGRVYDAHSSNPKATFTIESKPVMGIVSEGMICSAKELGLSNDHEGILILEEEMPLGTDLAALLKDLVLEIENKSLSHRPDCFSHIGIAREIAAMFDLQFSNNHVEHALVPTKQLPLEVQKKVSDELCARFTSICIADVHVHPSPLWLQSMLATVGVRPINNIVDAANYLMMDNGQPLHTYDYDKVDSAKLVIRLARTDEEIETLDTKKYKLEQDDIVIANGSKLDDIAGIMGGANSEIGSTTKNIIIEAANFNMYSIRKTSRRLGLRTEASTRFEKGQDPEQTLPAIKAAVQLISDLAQGEIASEINDIYDTHRKEAEVPLDLTYVKRFLGIELTTKEIVAILEKLHLKVKDSERIPNMNLTPDLNQVLTVIIPTYRYDIKIEADLMEEIARSYGYDKFQPTLPQRAIIAIKPNKGTILQRLVSSTLTASGMDELYTYSFVGPKLYEKLGLEIKDCLAIKNPISPDASHLRNLLLSNLIEKIELNQKKYPDFAYFEIGRVIEKELDEHKIHLQPVHIAGVQYSNTNEVIYFKIKGVLEQLAKILATEFEYKPLSPDIFFIGKKLLHPGRSAQIFWKDEFLGFVGELHPAITHAFGLKGRAAVFELDASILAKKAQYQREFKDLSVYQEIKRDLSYWIAVSTKYNKVVETIKTLDLKLLQKIELVDIFNNPKDEKQKSITLSLTLQSDKETLSDEQVNQVTTAITEALHKELQAELRQS